MCKQRKHRIGSVTKTKVAVVEGVIHLVGCKWGGGGGGGLLIRPWQVCTVIK